VPIWWKNQKNFLQKFQKLQNKALRVILGVFRTSPTKAMEIEAALPPPEIRFEKICINYALRILQIGKKHPIQARKISPSFGDLEFPDFSPNLFDEFLGENQKDLENQENQENQKNKKK
jgi:hypothetical protein